MLTEAVLTHVELVAAVMGVVAVLYGFYTDWVPDKIRRTVGYYDLKEDVEGVKKDTDQLREDHRETIQKLETLEQGQMHIADRVSNEHDNIDMGWFHDNLDVDHPGQDDD